MNALTAIRLTHRVLGTVAPHAAARVARRLLMTPQRHAPRDWEHDALAVAEPLTFRFGLTGLRWGGEGPVVLMMHGWSGRPSQFAHFIGPLLAAGRQVVALSAPAHGRSPGREAHPVAFTEALLEAGAELRDIESVVGHSMGGAAAVLAVHRGLPARRVVTLGSPAAMSRVLDRFAHWVALPPRARAAFFRVVDRHVGVPAEALDIARLARELPVPALVVHDRDDDAVPFTEAEAMVADWPHARLLETQGLGHRRVLTDPRVVGQTVDFLLRDAHPALAA